MCSCSYVWLKKRNCLRWSTQWSRQFSGSTKSITTAFLTSLLTSVVCIFKWPQKSRLVPQVYCPQWFFLIIGLPSTIFSSSVSILFAMIYPPSCPITITSQCHQWMEGKWKLRLVYIIISTVWLLLSFPICFVSETCFFEDEFQGITKWGPTFFIGVLSCSCQLIWNKRWPVLLFHSWLCRNQLAKVHKVRRQTSSSVNILGGSYQRHNCKEHSENWQSYLERMGGKQPFSLGQQHPNPSSQGASEKGCEVCWVL